MTRKVPKSLAGAESGKRVEVYWLNRPWALSVSKASPDRLTSAKVKTMTASFLLACLHGSQPKEKSKEHEGNPPLPRKGRSLQQFIQ
jgi:hypothetical protein